MTVQELIEHLQSLDEPDLEIVIQSEEDVFLQPEYISIRDNDYSHAWKCPLNKPQTYVRTGKVLVI